MRTGDAHDGGDAELARQHGCVRERTALGRDDGATIEVDPTAGEVRILTN